MLPNDQMAMVAADRESGRQNDLALTQNANFHHSLQNTSNGLTGALQQWLGGNQQVQQSQANNAWFEDKQVGNVRPAIDDSQFEAVDMNQIVPSLTDNNQGNHVVSSRPANNQNNQLVPSEPNQGQLQPVDENYGQVVPNEEGQQGLPEQGSKPTIEEVVEELAPVLSGLNFGSRGKLKNPKKKRMSSNSFP